MDDLCKRAVALSAGKQPGQVKGYKVDLHRAFRQIPTCPRDWTLLGTYWQGAIFLDKVAIMGSRTGPLACQRVTNMFRHFMADMGHDVKNFVDDFMGIELAENIWEAYYAMKRLLRNVGVDEAEDKAVPPAYCIEFLGVLFDLWHMTMSIPEDKMLDIQEELELWKTRHMTTRKQLERLLGRLQFLGSCIRPGRVFVSRLIQELKNVHGLGLWPITEDIRKDLQWWKECMQQHNGVAMLWQQDWTTGDGWAATDSCLTGVGGVLGDQCYRAWVPLELQENVEWTIAHLEFLSILVLVQVFKEEPKGRRMKLWCNNQAVVLVINTGRAKDKLLQQCLRCLYYLLIQMDCLVRMHYIPSKENKISDALSRSFQGGQERRYSYGVLAENKLQERWVSPRCLVISDPW